MNLPAFATEKELQATVIDLARRCNWLVWHDNDSRRNRPGLPDLILCHKQTGRTLFVELKSDRGKLRPEQAEWFDALRRGEAEAYIWRPEDWGAGLIQATLMDERVAA